MDKESAASPGLHYVAYPNESPEYREARNALLAEEIELRRQLERVAARRRTLPDGGAVREDYVFQRAGEDGQPTKVALSELFEPGRNTLMIYSFPYAPAHETPPPDATYFLDMLDRAAPPLLEYVSLAVVAKSPLPRLQALAAERGWQNLPLLWTSGNTYPHDYFGDTLQMPEEVRRQVGVKKFQQVDLPMLNVFRRDGDAISHVWGAELLTVQADPTKQHGDMLAPVWAMLEIVTDRVESEMKLAGAAPGASSGPAKQAAPPPMPQAAAAPAPPPPPAPAPAPPPPPPAAAAPAPPPPAAIRPAAPAAAPARPAPAAPPAPAKPAPAAPKGPDIAALVRSTYKAYETKDRTAIEQLLTANFTFTSPYDRKIDRKAYFARYWDNAPGLRAIRIEKLVVDGSEAFVRYEVDSVRGGRFRNAEHLRFEGDKLAEIQVFFGQLPDTGWTKLERPLGSNPKVR